MLEHTLGQSEPQERATPELALSFARTPAEVMEAQRLRYRVFAGELGAKMPTAAAGIDSDFYDAHCEHLLVRDTGSGEVVGTYRLLPGPRAQRLGSFYADGEFDLTRLRHLREATVEIGRSCVHPDYRNGATIARLWSGLIGYAAQRGYRYLMGCASLGMADGGHAAAAIYRSLACEHLSPVEYRVFPRCELPLDALGRDAGAVSPPPLVKAYARIGAWICGAPAWDPDFNTADLLMLLPLSRMNARYARHFMHG
ncbi:MAG: GNAT family N-acetyltransferase [Burkholderiales bacterium]|nr:GNAT family N-acetyltransferase [Burkholderiales bacterium]